MKVLILKHLIDFLKELLIKGGDMKICPKCGKLGIENDPFSGIERCLWKDCLWVNKEGKKIKNNKCEFSFANFKKTLKPKTF